MHVDEVLCLGENGRATWETSHRDCMMRKVMSKEVTAGVRSDFFLDSAGTYTKQIFSSWVPSKGSVFCRFLICTSNSVNGPY